MKSSLKIGVTGGIGSGKSTVCKIIETLGYPVYYSDEAARRLMHENQELIAEIKSAFGEKAYIEGKLNRTFLSQIVFSNPDKKEIIDSLVHPRVRKDFSDWTLNQDSAMVFQESALLFETGNYKLFDKSILVLSPIELRISRLLKRDNSTEDQIRSRIANQMPDEEKLKLADFVIENNEQQLVIPQLLNLISNLQD